MQILKHELLDTEDGGHEYVSAGFGCWYCSFGCGCVLGHGTPNNLPNDRDHFGKCPKNPRNRINPQGEIIMP